MAQLLDQDLRIRSHIYDAFVRQGHPPSAAETARDLGLDAARVTEAYARLHEAHAIVLRHGDRTRIRVAHPLSAYPTPFWVTTPKGSWWGNCMWDSLAIPAMLRCDATIRTTSGAMAEPAVVHVRDGTLQPAAGVVHVPLPAARWWDDVDFTCAHLLYFRSADEVDAWLARTGNARGEILPLDALWRLTLDWYGDRLDPAWRPRTAAQAEAILAKHGLTGAFWTLHG